MEVIDPVKSMSIITSLKCPVNEVNTQAVLNSDDGLDDKPILEVVGGVTITVDAVPEPTGKNANPAEFSSGEYAVP